MNFTSIFAPETAALPFESYEQFTAHLFACVDQKLKAYVSALMSIFANENGGYKNALYPDIEIAHGLCEKHLSNFLLSHFPSETPEKAPEAEGIDEFACLFSGFAAAAPPKAAVEPEVPIDELLTLLRTRAELTCRQRTSLPLFKLCKALNFSNFTLFCFACALLSSTQTNYASIFQVVGQNGSLCAPSIESAARIYYGPCFSISGAYGEMSLALEQLAPVFNLQITAAMPFSTVVSPDKRLIDFLFGKAPQTIDAEYKRFFTAQTENSEPDPFLANCGQFKSLTISYDEGTRVFSLYGDEGSGRRFTLRHFCLEKGLSSVTVDGGKLFSCDLAFVQKALWSVTRECILLDACCCLSNLSYREEEKERFFGYMDLFFERLTSRRITVFTLSRDKLPLREMTSLDFTQLDLPTPDNGERERLWQYYSKGYFLAGEVDLSEMAAKFLFTAGKIKSALRLAKSLAAMAQCEQIPRAKLFEACYSQMSHELTQKATKIAANFTWDDIVMSKDQRQALQYACDQMRYRKQVYEEWDYNRKYQYGRGLSVLLFGAPGTGKSMCAQVIANALNLELYRVDLSKVVDKYVGETEKSISMIFREAKKCNVVLFFDECDTLFAKRADDGGANQSSNNNKTALLLQEVEAYDGVSVMATNYKHNIDPAFFRRMKFIVEFQFPDPVTRLILWKATIPKNTPLAEDVDLKFLADRFEFVGGNIKNCILNAAFMAAGDPESGGSVHMKHYLLAIRYEFVKTGKVFTRSDFEPYADLVL